MHSYFLLFKTCSLKHIPMGEFCSFIANAELCCFCVPSDVKVAIILIDRAYSHNVSRHVHNDVTPTQTLQWKNNYLILIHLHEPNIWIKTDKCVKIFGYFYLIMLKNTNLFTMAGTGGIFMEDHLTLWNPKYKLQTE